MTDHGEIVRKDKWNIKELSSLTRKTAIVTGANSPDGIGYNVAYQFFLAGAKVFVGARSLEKALSAIELMVASSPSLDSSLLKPLVMDLGDWKNVKMVAEKLLEEEDRLDIVVNNAGLLSRSKATDLNAYGISPGFGTNHLGPFLFTTTLLPLLVKTAKLPNSDVRIVTVSSTAHYVVPETAKFDSLAAFNESFQTLKDTTVSSNSSVAINALGTEGIDNLQANFIRYGFSKLANILFAKELQRRLGTQGIPILSLSVHPGMVATNGAAGLFGGRDNHLFRASISPADGGLTPLFAAAHPEPRAQEYKYRGGFLLPWGGLKEPSALARDERLAKQLWETSETVLAEVFKA